MTKRKASDALSGGEDAEVKESVPADTSTNKEGGEEEEGEDGGGNTEGGDKEGGGEASEPTPKKKKIVRRQKWTPEDDDLLLEAAMRSRPLEDIADSVAFSRDLPFRDIKHRWQTFLNNKLQVGRLQKQRHSAIWGGKRVVWTKAEEERLLIETARMEANGISGHAELVAVYKYELHPSRVVRGVDNMVRRRCKSREDLPALIARFNQALYPNNQPRNPVLDYIKNTDRSHLINARVAKYSKYDTDMVKAPEDTGPPVLAVITGTNISYQMVDTKIVIGRATPDNTVDVDLSLEGDAKKVSRRAIAVEQKRDHFLLINLGRKPFTLDQVAIHPKAKRKIKGRTVLDIGGFSLTFKPYIYGKGTGKGKGKGKRKAAVKKKAEEGGEGDAVDADPEPMDADPIED